MKAIWLCRYVLALLLLAPLLLGAQTTLPIDSTDSRTKPNPFLLPTNDTIATQTAGDTIAQKRTKTTISLNTKADTTAPKLRYYPKKALRWSLLPGGGQIYNQQYWKAPLMMGGFGGALFMTVKRKIDYDRDYDQYTAELATTGSGLPPTLSTEQLANLRQNKKNALRDYNRWRSLTVVAYGVNLLDAFASAYVRNDRKSHSPVKAAYYAAILPGLGQAYNRKYWKIPIVYGGFAAAGYVMYVNGNGMQRATQEYLARTRPGYGTLDPELAIYNTTRLLQIRGIYKRYYEISIIVASVWYLLNIFDATTDAHLNDFDISDDLSWQIQPYIDSGNRQGTDMTGTNPIQPWGSAIAHSGLTWVYRF